jgi:hypothetical protein
VTHTESSKLGHIATTFGAWGVLRENLGTDVVKTYQGGVGEGEVGLMYAIHTDREVRGNKPKFDMLDVPSCDMLVRYLPGSRRRWGPPPLRSPPSCM